VFTINVDGKNRNFKASPMGLLLYRQEFDADLITDFSKIVDNQILDMLAVYKILWAMEKTANLADDAFPGFTAWLASFDLGIDLTDKKVFGAFAEEASRGFLGTSKIPGSGKVKGAKQQP